MSFAPVQRFFFGLNKLYNRVVWRTQVNRPLPVAPNQGAIIIANHRSGCDPMFIQWIAPRVTHWMVAREYCERWPLSWFFRKVEAIPANRGGVDTKAIKQAIRYAREGGLVGMLPEGRINDTDAFLLPARPGAALVALKARVPVIPVYIAGAPYNGWVIGPLFMPSHVKVTIGDPIDISEFYGREREPGVTRELTKRFMREIARLGGKPDFEPEIAGRLWNLEDPEIAAAAEAAEAAKSASDAAAS
jgi:1-acyl-sn-glycerol-3-phosphate acyltransferase